MRIRSLASTTGTKRVADQKIVSRGIERRNAYILLQGEGELEATIIDVTERVQAAEEQAAEASKRAEEFQVRPGFCQFWTPCSSIPENEPESLEMGFCCPDSL